MGFPVSFGFNTELLLQFNSLRILVYYTEMWQTFRLAKWLSITVQAKLILNSALLMWTFGECGRRGR